MNYDIQSTPTAIIITPDRKIVEQYIWPPTRKNLNDALLTAGGIMVGVNDAPETEETDFTIFPNPAKHNTSISFNSSGSTYQVQMISLTGSIVYQAEKEFYPEGEQTLDIKINELKKGIYFVILRSDDKKSHTQRLIVL